MSDRQDTVVYPLVQARSGHLTLRSIRAVQQGQLMGLPCERCAAKTLAVRYHGAKLTAQRRASLERDGYLVVPSLLTQAVIGRMTGRLEELVRQTVAAWQAHPSPDIAEPGVVRAKLDLADPDFAPCTDHPLPAQTATAVLGQHWHLAALSLRAPLPGCGHQGLHPDFDERRTDGPWQTLSAMWCISAFTKDNGPLRVIPGSHRVSEPPVDMLAFGSGMGPHPDEVRIVAPAGSVILFSSADLWHSGTFNYSPAPRFAVTACFNPGSSCHLCRCARAAGPCPGMASHGAELQPELSAWEAEWPPGRQQLT